MLNWVDKTDFTTIITLKWFWEMRLMSASCRDFSQSVSTYHDLCPDEDNLQIVIKDTVV